MAWGTPLGRYRWMSLFHKMEGSCSLAVAKKLDAGLSQDDIVLLSEVAICRVEVQIGEPDTPGRR